MARYINKSIIIWNKHKILSKKAFLIHKESLTFHSLHVILKRKNNYVWFEECNYISLVNNSTYYPLFKKILYGPIVTPIKWFHIPKNNTYEKYWCLVMKRIYAFVTHTYRVKNHIIKNTKCYSYKYKYIVFKPCIEIQSKKLYIKKYSERDIDFLVYIKYADINRMYDEKILINFLKKRYKINIVKYGNYTKTTLLYLVNKTKFVIYFSFYDTGAMSLIEMRVMGVWPISHQEEFIEEGYGSVLKDLDVNINNSLSKLRKIYNIEYNPKILSQNVIKNHNCVNSLFDVVNYIRK